MEAVPRMPMIWLDLKEAGEFQFSTSVKQFILKNYGEDPDNYNEQLKKLEQLRQSAVNVTRDFEGCSTLRKYFGQLHYLQSRVPMGPGQEAAVPISWTEIFSGKTVSHDDISYEQACILYNLGALHSMLGAMDNRVSEEGMKVSCTHFQCSAGAFSYLRDHFSHNFSVDMSHQILNLNINLMLGQAQECLLEKSMLDNRKSFLVARISAQVVDYYKEACRALDNSETASMLGKIQKDWKKLVQMKIYYFAAIAHLHMGKQAEEQQKFGERLAYLQSSLDKLGEAMKLAKGQPDSVQEALRFTMDVIGGKFNSAQKDNDFIYHENVPSLETLPSVKGAPLVKALPVNPTDPSVTGPDIFSKLVPMAAHEASSLYSEEKAKLLREIMAKVDSKNETLEQFMDSVSLDPDSIDNTDKYSTIPPVVMEKCAALSVRPDTVKSLIQSMQALSGVFTDVEASLREIRDVLDKDEAEEQSLQEAVGKQGVPPPPPSLSELRRELEKYLEYHEKASFTNTELHRAMNLHISHLRLLGGPLESLKEALPRPELSEEDAAALQLMKRILAKVQEMREQRSSLEKQLRQLIQQDDITSALVTTERAEMKRVFEEQLKKYDQVKLYIDQNLAAQENILKALTEANVQSATARKTLTDAEQKWNSTVQTLVASYEAYEDLMKKSQEGKEFYEDLEGKASKLLEKAKAVCQVRAEERQAILERELQKKAPQRPTAPKPPIQKKAVDIDPNSIEDPELAQLTAAILALGGDLPEDLRSMPPEFSLPPAAQPPLPGATPGSAVQWPGVPPAAQFAPVRFPPNLPSPELLARFSRLPTPQLPHSLPSGSIPHQLPQFPTPQAPQPPPVGPYAPQPSQAPGGPPTAPALATGTMPAPVPVRPSTTTVESNHTPVAGNIPTPSQPVSIAPASHPVPAGYVLPPQAGAYPQYVQQPRVPPGIQPQQQHFPQTPAPVSLPGHQPPPYLPLPAQAPAPMPMPGAHMPLPPQSQHYQNYVAQQRPYPPNFPPVSMPGQVPASLPPATPPHSQATLPPQQGHPPVSMFPGTHPAQVPINAVAQTHVAPRGGPHPQVPPSSQPMPPTSMPYATHGGQQMPPAPQQYMPAVNTQMQPAQHPQRPLPVQQMPPGPGVHMPTGVQPRMPAPGPQLPPSSHAMPPVSHTQMLPITRQVSPPSHPQIPPVSQQPPHFPQVAPQPFQPPSFPHPQPARAPHIQVPSASVASQVQIQPSGLPPPQQPSLPRGPQQTHPLMPPHMHQQPIHMQQQQPLLPHTGGAVVYPGSPYVVQPRAPSITPQQPQPLTPQPLVPQQMPQPQPTQSSYAPPGSGNVPAGHGQQHSGGVGPAPAPPNTIPPSAGSVGPPAPVLPSPVPSPAPSPGPSSLGMSTQRPSPAITPVGVSSLPPAPSSSSSSSSSSGPASDPLFQRQNSSTDDLLSSSPESQHGGTKDTANVLLPTKADPQEDGQRRKKSEGVRIIKGDPYQAPERVSRLCAELEHFRSLVQSLELPTGEGVLSKLDTQWKDLMEQQEKDARQLSIAIARCYTMKNRHQDIMPYDRNRVVLRSGKDDYINASFIEDLSPYCPRLIATQAPLTGTASDFWLMVYEQKVSLVVMLVSEQELEKQKVPHYFPCERGQQLSQGPITLTLTTHKTTPTHVERMISLQYRDQSLKRTVIHLQFISWPELGLPDSKGNLIRFIQELHGHYLHQRPLHTPIIVHCSSGVGRTGALCLLYAALQEVEAGNGIPDLTLLVRKMRQQRKNMLQEKLHLKFCYEAVLKHAEQVLQRHGIAPGPAGKTANNSSIKQPYSRPECQDIVLGGDLPISSIQATIAKLSIRPQSASDSEPDSSLELPQPAPTDSSLQEAPADAPQDSSPADPEPPTLSPSPSISPPSVSPARPHSPASPVNQGNGLVEPSPGSPPTNHHAVPAVDLPETASPSPPPTSMSSSLDLLASLTPEAFTLDAACRGKQRFNKQSFLQPQEGQGLQGPPQTDDPLSNLDPLWTLNKT